MRGTDIWKVIIPQNLLRLFLLLGVFLPLDVSLPSFILLLKLGNLPLGPERDCIRLSRRHVESRGVVLVTVKPKSVFW